MILQNVPGIDIFFDFSSKFSPENPLDIEDLFDKPQRSLHGYFWEIDSRILRQTRKYRSYNTSFSGFFVSNYEDAGVVMSLFNRVFYMTFVKSLDNWESQEKKNSSRIKIDTETMNRIRWEAFYSHLKESFSTYHTPFRKFLASKRPDRCWISFSDSEITPRDPIYLDFLCGVHPLEFKYPGFKIGSDEWKSAIKEGPLGNPEIPIVEKFFHYFPGSIHYTPDVIRERFEIDHLKGLSDFGII